MANFRRRKSTRSHGEKEILEFLEEQEIKYNKEQSFDDCLSPKGRKLRFDFFLPEYNLLIEYQGVHHYKPANSRPRARWAHNTTVKHDYIKKVFVEQNNLKLLCIPHWERPNIRDIILNYIREIGETDNV